MKDRRKYQRVLVEPSSKVLTVEVLGHGRILMFDMSYEGAAFSQPSGKKISDVDKLLKLHLKTEVDEAVIESQSVRVNDEVVAVRFEQIDPLARIIIDRVVTDRIIGLNMALIDPKHYSHHTDFNYWFHGPKETNLFLWMDSGTLVKAQMEMADSAMTIDDDMIFFENKALQEGIPVLNNEQIARKVQSIIEQIETNLPAITQFKEILNDHIQS